MHLQFFSIPQICDTFACRIVPLIPYDSSSCKWSPHNIDKLTIGFYVEKNHIAPLSFKFHVKPLWFIHRNHSLICTFRNLFGCFHCGYLHLAYHVLMALRFLNECWPSGIKEASLHQFCLSAWEFREHYHYK